MYVEFTSVNGPFHSGLVDFDSIEALKDAINGAGIGKPVSCVAVRHPESGKVTLVSVVGMKISEVGQ